jgi:hypothetical protein
METLIKNSTFILPKNKSIDPKTLTITIPSFTSNKLAYIEFQRDEKIIIN